MIKHVGTGESTLLVSNQVNKSNFINKVPKISNKHRKIISNLQGDTLFVQSKHKGKKRSLKTHFNSSQLQNSSVKLTKQHTQILKDSHQSILPVILLSLKDKRLSIVSMKRQIEI